MPVASRFRGQAAKGVLGAARLGAFVLIASPLLWYLGQYWWAFGSFDGLIEQLPAAALESAVDFAGLALRDPLRALLMAALGTATWWLAFGRPRKDREDPKDRQKR